MTETFWVGIAAVVASLATLVTAIGAVIVGIRTTRKADQILVKSEEIHKSTNSNLALVTENLAIANAKIERLQTVLVDSLAGRVATAQSDDTGASH